VAQLESQGLQIVLVEPAQPPLAYVPSPQVEQVVQVVSWVPEHAPVS
jgi:hypothetical protein